MGVYDLEGTGLAVSGYEEDYLDFGPGFVGITDLVTRAAGVGSPDWSVLTAFEYCDSPASENWQETADGYRLSTGRKWPPVYRVRIHIEAEELSPDEADAWWVARRT